MKCEECQVLLDEYLDDSLPAEMRRQVASHVAACAPCGRVYRQLVRTQEAYRQYVAAASPPGDIAAKVMAGLTAPWAVPLWPLVAAAVMLAMVLAVAGLTAAVWEPFVLVGYDLAGRLLPVPAIVLSAFPMVKIVMAVTLIIMLAATMLGMRRLVLS